MSQLIDVHSIIMMQQECILHWKKYGISFTRQGFYLLAEENHSFNYQLWHTEDQARRDDMGFEFVYHAKRKIDSFNQQRNNRMEMMDEWLFHHLTPAPHQDCPVHSETPGMMIDRLSILSLKSYHMGLQVQRRNVDETHRKNCTDKLQIILEQQKQLAHCLQVLLSEIGTEKRTFRVYHQFKMYNDPKLNPELY